jgi:putative transposase
VNQICQLVGISKKTYYHSQEPQERLSEKYHALRPILNQLVETHPSYGLPRLKKALAEQEGLVVNQKLLRRLLGVWGLNWPRRAGAGQHKQTWVQRVIEELGPRANLVRQIQISAPFQVLVTDMTRLAGQAGIAYLCVHLDWFGKLVLGWDLSRHPDAALAVASLQAAKVTLQGWQRDSLAGLIVHQDQGSPYTSGEPGLCQLLAAGHSR